MGCRLKLKISTSSSTRCRNDEEVIFKYLEYSKQYSRCDTRSLKRSLKIKQIAVPLHRSICASFESIDGGYASPSSFRGERRLGLDCFEKARRVTQAARGFQRVSIAILLRLNGKPVWKDRSARVNRFAWKSAITSRSSSDGKFWYHLW